MEARVAVLETHMEYVRADLADIKSTLRDTSKALTSLTMAVDAVNHRLDDLPTKQDLARDLATWQVQWIIIALAIAAMIVAGIIGGLDWIKTH
jgi:hypothetical protein